MRGSKEKDEESYFNEGSKPVSVINFARQSNLLSGAQNKYGLPIVGRSEGQVEEEEDPLDAYMKEIESLKMKEQMKVKAPVQRPAPRGEVMGFQDDDGRKMVAKQMPKDQQIKKSAKVEESKDKKDFDELEQSILNDDGELDVEKLR